MGSLIQKVTKRARELLEKKSKPRTKGKSANGTSRYSKSKRQKLLIGGVSVNIDDKKKEDILNIIGIRTKEAGKEKAQAHLVELLKLKTIQKIESKLLEYSENLLKIDGRTTTVYSQDEIGEVAIMEKVLLDVGEKLILLKSEDHEDFKKKQTNLKEFFINANSNSQEIKDRQKEIYSYKLFTGELEDYKLCNIDKEITALNIFKLFYDLTTMDEDKRNGMKGGGIYEHFQISLIGEDGLPIGGPITRVVSGDPIVKRIEAYKELLEENKKTIKNIRDEFLEAGLVLKKEKNELISVPGVRRSPIEGNNQDLLGGNYTNIIVDSERNKFNTLLQQIRDGGKFTKIEYKGRAKGEGGKAVDPYYWPGPDKDGIENAIPLYVYTLAYERNEYIVTLQVKRSNKDHEQLTALIDAVSLINENIVNIINSYRNNSDPTEYYDKIITYIESIKNNYSLLAAKYDEFKPDKLIKKTPQVSSSIFQGGNPVKYKSTGQVVHIMFQNKKYKRVIYVKEKRNTKYCKMNNEYILLSKLKVVE